MASNWIIRKDVELTRIGSIDPLTNVGYIYKADNQAHVWEAHLYKDGQPATLTGYSARGYFIRSDGSTIAVSGSISGNVASVTFNNSCYAYKGLLKGALRLEKTNEIITVAALYAIVEVAATDTVVINTETEPDVEEILAELDTAITNAQEAASELSTAIEDKAVIYTGAQSLTDAQKSTARGNIGAVSANQGAVNEGFALMVGPGGNVVPAEAGLSEATKTALLNIFQHVAYTDAQGQTYYDALYAALYASAYPRISATFDPGSNIIYVDEGLNALKQYMTVKMYEDVEDEGTVVASTDYTLTGTLADGENTVVVGYDGMVASVQVEAVDFYDKWEWTLSGGDIQVIDGGASYNVNPPFVYIGAPGTRKAFVTNRGVMAYYADANKSEMKVGCYPIPVPRTATKVTMSVTPNDIYFGPRIVRYTGVTYENVDNAGWKENGSSYSFDAGENLFLTMNSKYQSSGTSYPVTPNSIVIEFE